MAGRGGRLLTLTGWCSLRSGWAWQASAAGGRGGRASSVTPVAGWGGSPGLCTITNPCLSSEKITENRD